MAVTREMIAYLRAENHRLRAQLREYQQDAEEPAYQLFRAIADNPPTLDLTGLALRLARRVFGSRPPDYARGANWPPPAQKRP